MCVRMLRSIFKCCHAWTLWNLWFQGLWKHVSVITNVISIAYCLVVLSISLITAFIGDIFMWFGEIGFGKLPFLEHKIYKYWLASCMREIWLVWWGNGSCSIIISCCWTRTHILTFLFIMQDEWVNVYAQFLFLVTVSHMTTHQLTPFIKQNLNLKAHPFLHILIYYKHILILRYNYNFSEHLKNIYWEYVQKCQNHKNCWDWELTKSTMLYITKTNICKGMLPKQSCMLNSKAVLN